MSRKDWSPKEADCGITIIHQVDETPDLHYYGEYSDTPKEHSIDRKERGDMGRNEYRYFNLNISFITENSRATQLEDNYQRMEAYNRQDWHMVGVIAVVVIELEDGDTEEIRSSGIWGVDSDSAADHMNELGDEQIQELFYELKARGIRCKQVKAKDVEIEYK